MQVIVYLMEHSHNKLIASFLTSKLFTNFLSPSSNYALILRTYCVTVNLKHMYPMVLATSQIGNAFVLKHKISSGQL